MPSRPLIVLAVASLMGALPAAAQQLLTNADFDADLACWANDQSVDQQWSAEDAESRPGSGSLAASSLDTGTGGSHFQAFQTHNVVEGTNPCVPVTPGETIYTSVMYRSEASVTRVYLLYYLDAACAYAYPGWSAYLDWDGPTTAWRTLRGAAVIPLTGVGAVNLAVNAMTNDSSTAFTIHVDGAYAGRTPRLLRDGFETGCTSEWIVPPA